MQKKRDLNGGYVNEERETSGPVRKSINPHASAFSCIPSDSGQVSRYDGTERKEDAEQKQRHEREGYYPTYVYIPIEYKQIKVLDAFVRERVSHKDPGNCRGIMWKAQGEEEEYHISICKTLFLYKHQISPFMKKLRSELIPLAIQLRTPTSSIPVSTLSINSNYIILENDTKTRRFVCLPVEDPGQYLQSISKKVDQVALSFNQEAYYKDPSFHISLGSYPIIQCEQIGERETEAGVTEFFVCHPESEEVSHLEPHQGLKTVVSFNQCQCKSGSKIYNVVNI